MIQKKLQQTWTNPPDNSTLIVEPNQTQVELCYKLARYGKDQFEKFY